MKFCKQLVIAGLAAMPLFFSACCTSGPAPSVLSEEDQKNIIIDESLQDKLAFEFIRTWPTENGLVNVAVRARIQTYCAWDWVFDSYKNLDIAYRFAWFNKDGVEVPADKKPVWNYVTVGYGEELGFGSMSPSAEIKTYKLFIRLVKPEEAAEAAKGTENAEPAAGTVQTEEVEKTTAKTADQVKTRPTSVTPIKADVKNAEEGKTAPKTADQVKTRPTSVTPIRQEVKKTQADEEAEADAAAARQAAPNKK